MCNRTKTRAACPARLTTNGFYAPVKIVTEHNHLPDDTKRNCLEVLNAIKDKARNTREAPRNIIVDSEQNLETDSAPNMPSMRCLQALISRERKRINIVPDLVDPTDILTLELPAELTKTESNEQFLFYDSGVYENKKSILYLN